MKTTTNIVIYAATGEGANPEQRRKPLISVSPDDASAVLKLAHAASQCFVDCDKRGVSHPELFTIQESRSADESGRINGRFTHINPATLKAVREGDRGGDDLNALFDSLTKKEGK